MTVAASGMRRPWGVNEHGYLGRESRNRAEGDVDIYVRQTFFHVQNSGVFVDVGAASPNFLCISALYRALGWTVIAVEPNPVFIASSGISVTFRYKDYRIDGPARYKMMTLATDEST